jgi:pSer/pThr/pTyr-binding forkhead associated (FHA) protein
MPSQTDPLPTLVLQQGPEPHRTYILEGNITTIGRDEENDIVINEGHLSAHHALVTKRADGWVIEDLASRSGVWVNGSPIKGPVFLREDVRINLGPNVLLIAKGGAFGEVTKKRNVQGSGLTAILLAVGIIILVLLISFFAGYYFLYT